jgi:hypothetical protein
MVWIVLGEEKGKILLTSKSNVPGLLPKGSFLTIEEDGKKFILRVDESDQTSPYSPSPMLVDMDLSPLIQDQKCQNIITAYRIKDVSNRTDGFIDYIKPQSIARRSTQEEINLALGNIEEGPKVFLATIHASQNQLIEDEHGKIMTATLPVDMFFHQMLIHGKTGSGKTVAAKYLAQYFVENLEGAVLAINVKEADLLKMNMPSETKNVQTKKEWGNLGFEPHGIGNFVIYYPANAEISLTKGVTATTQKITLKVDEIDPESLSGLLQGVTDIAAQNLPDIFRYWKEKVMVSSDKFIDFLEYFNRGADTRTFRTLNNRGDESEVPLHRGTFDNIQRNLASAVEFFDNEDAKSLDWDDILATGKMSVIDVAVENGVEFGSVLLRDLLKKIVTAKSDKKSGVPILIIIDEVHQFYDTQSTREALGALDTISRTGRSQKIGVIFSSQNPSDIPKDLANVVNTKIFFKTEPSSIKDYGVRIRPEEVESLKKGFAIASIHDLSQLKILKFPMSFSGVFEQEGK